MFSALFTWLGLWTVAVFPAGDPSVWKLWSLIPSWRWEEHCWGRNCIISSCVFHFHWYDLRKSLSVKEQIPIWLFKCTFECYPVPENRSLLISTWNHLCPSPSLQTGPLTSWLFPNIVLLFQDCAGQCLSSPLHEKFTVQTQQLDHMLIYRHQFSVPLTVVVRGVAVSWTRVPKRSKVRYHVLGLTAVHGWARRQEHHQVKELKDIWTRLMDWQQHQPVPSSQTVQCNDQIMSCEAVQTWSRLI